MVKQAPNGGGGAAVATPVNEPHRMNSFVRASMSGKQEFESVSQLISTATFPVGPLSVPTMGFLRKIRLHVVGAGSVDSTGANAAFAADGPFTVLDSIVLKDTTGNPIVGTLTGWDIYLINKYGGYRFGVGGADPKSDPNYLALGGATGNFEFDMDIPVEATPRDGFGALANMTTASQFQLAYQFASTAAVYSVVPDLTQATVTVRPWIEAWQQPENFDPFGVPNETAPPGLDAVSYWSKEIHNVISGENRIRLNSMGNHLRNILLIFRQSGVRNTANFPTVMRWEIDNQIIDYRHKSLWQNDIFRTFGFAPDLGVFPICLTDDADGTPGNENRNKYIPTSTGTKFEFVGTFGGAGSLEILVNHVSAPTGTPRLNAGNPGH